MCFILILLVSQGTQCDSEYMWMNEKYALRTGKLWIVFQKGVIDQEREKKKCCHWQCYKNFQITCNIWLIQVTSTAFSQHENIGDTFVIPR